MVQPGFFDLDERYRRLSQNGDPLVKLAAPIDFQAFRPMLAATLKRSDGSKGGRPPYDPVRIFSIPVLQTLYPLSDDHFRRQPGHDLTPAQRKANRACSRIRSAVETVFAGQTHRFGLFVRTIGLARARAKIGLANLADNLERFLWIETRPVAA